MIRVLVSALAPILLTVTLVGGQAVDPIGRIKTLPEKTSFHDTSRYSDVIAFLEAIRKASPRVHLTTFGTTHEGRTLPLAVVGAPDATPAAVRRTNKLRVYLQANIHGGEVEGKESTQMLLRDLAGGKHDDWLERIVFLVAPIYNADGNERFALNNRGPQYGPLGGQGQRPNAQGLDLNRDHMKLDSPEGRAVVKLMNDYDPHVSIDLHTTNGTRHGYHLTYAAPLNPATNRAIVGLLRGEWLPHVSEMVREKHGWEYYSYGNVPGGRGAQPGERRWVSFDHRPRFNNNYIGLRNRFALLGEAYAYATFEDRILATSRFLEEALDFASAHVDRIKRITEAADRERIVGTQLPLRGGLQRGQPVRILMGEVTEEKHPVDGHIMHLRKDVRIPETMIEFGTFKATETARVPATYFIPPTLTTALDRLTAHGIVTTRLASAMKVPIEEFRIETSAVAPTPFQNHTERTLTGRWVPAERELPAGTLRVDMTQPLARLAFYLIEPRSDDGLVNWNLVDEALAGAEVYPIVRSRN